MVRITSEQGLPAIAALVPTGLPAADGEVRLHLGRFFWSRLAVMPGDAVEFEPIELPVASSVRLRVRDPGGPAREAFDPASLLGGLPVATGRRFELSWGPWSAAARVGEADPETAVVGDSTVISVEWTDHELGGGSVTMGDVGGSRAAIEMVEDLLVMPLHHPGSYREAGVPRPRGALLFGPPGTGKTLITKAVASRLGVNLFTLSGSDLVGGLRGETEKMLRDLFKAAREAAPSLVVIDEFDALGAHRDRLSSQDDVRSVSQLLSLMDGLEPAEGVFVLATTNRPDAIDAAFRRPGRFDLEIRIPVPEPDERYEILLIHSREMPLSEAAAEGLRGIALQAVGFVGADLMNLMRMAGLQALRRAVRSDRPVEVDFEDLEAALGRQRPSALSGLDVSAPSVSWDDIVGLDAEKHSLVEAAERAFDGGSGVEGVLLHGPPGNGKTALVHALAAHLGARLITLEQARIYRPWLGESEEALREFFERAITSRPAIVALEHLPAIAPARSTSSERTDDRVRAALLGAIDRVMAAGGLLVVGVAVSPEEVAADVIRPGRLGRHIEIPNPGEARRMALAERIGGGAMTAETVATIARETDGASAAAVVMAALRQASIG